MCVCARGACYRKMTTVMLLMMMLSYSWRKFFTKAVAAQRGKSRTERGKKSTIPEYRFCKPDLCCCTHNAVAVKAILNWNFCFLEACRCCIRFSRSLALSMRQNWLKPKTSSGFYGMSCVKLAINAIGYLLWEIVFLENLYKILPLIYSTST